MVNGARQVTFPEASSRWTVFVVLVELQTHPERVHLGQRWEVQSRQILKWEANDLLEDPKCKQGVGIRIGKDLGAFLTAESVPLELHVCELLPDPGYHGIAIDRILNYAEELSQVSSSVDVEQGQVVKSVRR